MKQPDDPTRAGDILDAAETIQRWVAGKSRTDFEADEILQSAVAYQLQIVGEAASHLSHQFRDALPAVPWRKIIAMRNILVHAYRRVEVDIVWDTVTDWLVPLAEAVRPYVTPLEEE